MRWTEDDIKNAGLVEDGKGNLVKAGSIRKKVAARVRPNDSGEMPKLESDPWGTVARANGAKKTEQAGCSGSDQFRIVVTSYRMRDIDPDNICPKWYIDALVECGVLPDDTGAVITGGVLKLTERVKTEQEERTEIRIEKLCR